MLYWFRTCIGYSSCKAFNDFRTLFNADDPAIQRNMIVGGIAPVHIGVEAVVGGAALVLLLQPSFGRFLPLPVDTHDAVCPELHVRVDEHLQAVFPVSQDIVAAPAHDDAGTLVGQLPYHVGLGEEGLVADGDAVAGHGGGPDADWGDGHVKAAAGPLLCPGDKVRGQAALLRRL